MPLRSRVPRLLASPVGRHEAADLLEQLLVRHPPAAAAPPRCAAAPTLDEGVLRRRARSGRTAPSARRRRRRRLVDVVVDAEQRGGAIILRGAAAAGVRRPAEQGRAPSGRHVFFSASCVLAGELLGARGDAETVRVYHGLGEEATSPKHQRTRRRTTARMRLTPNQPRTDLPGQPRNDCAGARRQ